LNETNEYQLDFHSLKVREAKEKLDILVVPILPVVKTMVLITGHGQHREEAGGMKHALMKHIESKHRDSIICEKVPTNFGAIRVQHINQQSGSLD